MVAADLGRVATRVTSNHYRLESLLDRIEKVDAVITQDNKDTSAHLHNLRVEVSALSDLSKDIGATKRLGVWAVGILLPMLLLGGVSVIQSMSRQDAMEKDIDEAAVKEVVVRNKINSIELDVSSIKQEQRSTTKTLEKVTDTLGEMQASQTRVETAINPRRKRRQ